MKETVSLNNLKKRDKEKYNYPITMLKNKKVIAPVCDVINSNRIFHQLATKGSLLLKKI